MRACGTNPIAASFLKLPVLPESDSYNPLFGDCTVPSAFLTFPPLQPTAASTLLTFSLLTPPGDMVTTSVTAFASKQGRTRFDLPAHGPVGRFTLANECPPSTERYNPLPVAAKRTLGCT